MTDNVTLFPGLTNHDLPPERVLQGAIEAELQVAVVIGRDRDGNLYTASSTADGAQVLWQLESAKRVVLDAGK